MKFKVFFILFQIISMYLMEAMDAPLSGESATKAESAGSNTSEEARLALSNREDVYSGSPLLNAVARGNTQIIKLLLRAGENPDKAAVLCAVRNATMHSKKAWENNSLSEHVLADSYGAIILELLYYGACIQDAIEEGFVVNNRPYYPGSNFHWQKITFPWASLTRLWWVCDAREIELMVLFGSLSDVELFLFPDSSALSGQADVWYAFWRSTEEQRGQRLEKALLLAAGQAKIDIVRLLLNHNIFAEAAVDNVSTIIKRLKRENAGDERIARYYKIQQLFQGYHIYGGKLEGSAQDHIHDVRNAELRTDSVLLDNSFRNS